MRPFYASATVPALLYLLRILAVVENEQKSCAIRPSSCLDIAF
jgi:hypothetical protein